MANLNCQNEKNKTKSSVEIPNNLVKNSNDLAKERTVLAERRTFLAAERTYSAWLRTGLAIASAGLTIGKALQDSKGGEIALFIGGTLITVGMFTLVYAWFVYKKVYDYLRNEYPKDNDKTHLFTMNIIAITLLTIILLVVCVFGFWFMLF